MISDASLRQQKATRECGAARGADSIVIVLRLLLYSLRSTIYSYQFSTIFHQNPGHFKANFLFFKPIFIKILSRFVKFNKAFVLERFVEFLQKCLLLSLVSTRKFSEMVSYS